MKREFLKELGLGGEQIEKIMAEHGKVVDKIRTTAETQLRDAAIDRLVGESGTNSPQIIKDLLLDCGKDDAEKRICEIKDSCPWLFPGELPVFSAPCEGLDYTVNPFRHGAGL